MAVGAQSTNQFFGMPHQFSFRTYPNNFISVDQNPAEFIDSTQSEAVSFIKQQEPNAQATGIEL